MDAGQNDERSRQDRAVNDRAVRGDHESEAPSRARLPRLSRHPAIGEELRRAAGRSRLPPRQRYRSDELRLRRLDPEAWARQSLRAGECPGRRTDPARRSPPVPPAITTAVRIAASVPPEAMTAHAAARSPTDAGTRT